MLQRPTARVFLLNNSNEVLLLKNKGVEENYWITPGGKIEDNETALQAVERELFEETGINDAQFHPEPYWYSEIVIQHHNQPTLFQEYYFLAYTTTKEFNFSGITDDEQHIIQGAAWWNLAALKKSTEKFYPSSIVMALEPVIQNNLIPSELLIIDP